MGCSAENTKPPARAAQAVQAGGTSVRVYSTQLLFVVIDVDIARGIFVLPQQQGGGERHSEGGTASRALRTFMVRNLLGRSCAEHSKCSTG